MHVYVLRGVPRCGKSTLARVYHAMFDRSEYSNRVRTLSADSYYTNSKGVYSYDSDLHADAHRTCFRQFLELISDPEAAVNGWVVVVDNTNSRLIEAAPYMTAAGSFGHGATLVTVLTPMEEVLRRNEASGTKKVPEVVILDMWARINPESPTFEEPPPWWRTKTLTSEDVGNLLGKFDLRP